MADLFGTIENFRKLEIEHKVQRQPMEIEQTKIELKLPAFPMIQSLKGFMDTQQIIWINCFDVFRYLESTVSQATMKHNCRKYSYIRSCFPNVVWNGSKWESFSSSTQMEMVSVNDLKNFITGILHRARKTKIQKMDLFKKFNIFLSEEEQHQMKVPIECSVLDVFIRACPFPVDLQYRVGKYRLDAFIPRLKMAIQIDEKGHKSYNQEEEKEYDTIIRDHNIVCIRYVPNENDSLASGLELVNKVWQRTLSPDFSSFLTKYGLA